QVTGRLFTGIFISAHTAHIIILGTVHPLTRLLDDKVVTCNAVDGGDTSRVYRAVANGRIGRHIGDIGVLAGKTFAQQPLEATLAVAFVKTVQVVPTHLVDH